MSSVPVAELVIKATIFVLVGLGARAVLRKGQSAIRHLILLLTLIGTLLIPIITPLVWFHASIPLPREMQLTNSSSGPMVDKQTATAPHVEMIIPTPSEIPWDAVVFQIWCLGFGLVVLRYLVGLVALRTVRNGATLVHQESHIESLAVSAGVTRQWELRISSSPSLKTAMTWGLWVPVVLLPQNAETWSSQRLEMVLLHEFAHQRRKDFVSQMLAELACAIYWFNPLVWLSARAMREDAELAADEAVIQAGFRPSDYAAELLQLAASLSTKRNRVLTQVGISNMTQPKIESRLNAILSSQKNDRGVTSGRLLITLAIATAAVSGIASLKLQNPTQQAAAEKVLALSRLKQVSTATLMYAADYDDQFPYVSSTPDVKKIISPYIKNKDSFNSPRKGAEFRYNLNIGGILLTQIESPPTIPMWYEVTPKDITPIGAFADGHVKVLSGQDAEDFAKNLKKTFPRKKKGKPVKVASDRSGIGASSPAPKGN